MSYAEQNQADRERRAAARMKILVAAGRLEQEHLDELGFTGSPGFIGHGVHGDGRRPGYLQRRP